MKGLLGIKLGMTQVIDDEGIATPVTIIQAGPCFVTQVKTNENDGYTAVQLGFKEVKESRLTKAEKGHLGLVKPSKKHTHRKKNNGLPAVKLLREFRTKSAGEYKVGQTITVDQFATGDRIDVAGVTKGRGFQGVVKRYGFRGGPKTHGQSDRHRAPGSIGATSSIGHVFKGTRMAGRMGNNNFTAENLEVIRIDLEKNLIAVKGSVPGTKGGFVVLKAKAKGG